MCGGVVEVGVGGSGELGGADGGAEVGEGFLLEDVAGEEESEGKEEDWEVLDWSVGWRVQGKDVLVTAEKKMETWDCVKSIVGGGCSQSENVVVYYSNNMRVV